MRNRRASKIGKVCFFIKKVFEIYKLFFFQKMKKIQKVIFLEMKKLGKPK